MFACPWLLGVVIRGLAAGGATWTGAAGGANEGFGGIWEGLAVGKIGGSAY
jgi:hypothetical protein